MCLGRRREIAEGAYGLIFMEVSWLHTNGEIDFLMRLSELFSIAMS